MRLGLLIAVAVLGAVRADASDCEARETCRAQCTALQTADRAACLAACGRDEQICSGQSGKFDAERPDRPEYHGAHHRALRPGANIGGVAGAIITAPKPAAKEKGSSAAPPIATRLFTAAQFRVPEGFGAIAVLIFPNEAALDPARQRLVCRAFVAVLDESAAVLAVNPRREQMVTIWPVTQVTTALSLPDVRRHDSAAVDAICPDAVAGYDYAQAAEWVAKLPARARPKPGSGPYLVAWAPPRQAGDPRAPILTYDLSRFATENELLDAFRIWKHDIEDDPSLWSDGWSLTRWQLTTRALVDRYGSEIGSALKLVPWLGH